MELIQSLDEMVEKFQQMRRSSQAAVAEGRREMTRLKEENESLKAMLYERAVRMEQLQKKLQEVGNLSGVSGAAEKLDREVKMLKQQVALVEGEARAFEEGKIKAE